MIDLNVCTLALPRLLVGRCLKSFLDCLEDRDRYRLNWICLLDHDEAIEARSKPDDCYAKTHDQIRDIEFSFDSFVVLLHHYQQGFGAAVSSLFCKAMSHEILWIPDDWLWTQSFKLADVLEQTDDCFSFVGRPMQPISSPTFYRRHVAAYLLGYFPENLDRLRETPIAKILPKQFRVSQHPNITGKVCRYLGDKE